MKLEVAVEARAQHSGTAFGGKVCSKLNTGHLAVSKPLSGTRRCLYITERCVFNLTPEGTFELIEIALASICRKDILDVWILNRLCNAQAPVLMDARIFIDSPMNIRRKML